jgi:tRNA(Ile2) C34 agmatinyltransferase TiaS
VLKEQGTLSLTGPTRILEIHDSSLHEAINEHTYLKKEILVKLWPKNYFCINKIRSVPNTAVANKKNTRSPYLPKLVEESVKGPECRLCGSTMEFDGAETWVCPSCGEIMEVPY